MVMHDNNDDVWVENDDDGDDGSSRESGKVEKHNTAEGKGTASGNPCH